MNEVFRGFARFGLFLFFAFTALLIPLYIWALSDKIANPGYKNLSYSDYAWLGLVMLAFAVADFFILRRFMRGSTKK